MRRALIDTNIYSLAMCGDASVIDRLQRLDDLTFSVISVGELLAGFRRGNQEHNNRSELARFLDVPRGRRLAVDEETADFYAATLNALRHAGTSIPTNGLWIAALAQRHGLPLCSKDAHFSKMPGLVLP